MSHSISLSDMALFTGLNEMQINEFVSATGSKIKSFDRGSRILRAFEANDYIWVLVNGRALVVSEDKFGNETTGHALERGAVMGATSAILNSGDNFTSIEAITNIDVLLIPYERLISMGPKMAHIHGIVMKNLLESFARKLMLMMEKLDLLTQKSLRQRILLYLSQQMRYQNAEKLQIPGRVQMARILSCNRSALTREISAMEQEGLIVSGRNWMQVLKEE